jgi:hypothetical protein
MMNWKGFGSKRSWPKLSPIPAFTEQNQENLNQNILCPCEVRTEHLPVMNLERYRYVHPRAG